MDKKVALLGIYHESNTFVKEYTTLTNFKEGRYFKGDRIVEEYRDAHHEIGGMIEVLERENVELIPIMYTEATPGGTITAETFQELLEDLITEVEKILPVDAFLVVPHGAGVSEEYEDMDGTWLKVLREKVGPSIPIVGTLDLHANVSQLMIDSTNALVSYKKNPHIDQRDRGKEAAELLIRQIKNEITLTQVLFQVPLAISIEQQLTDNEPCKSLYSYAEELAREPRILSLSIQLGFPYADVKDMGTSIIVVSDEGASEAFEVGKKLEEYIVNQKESFVGKKIDVPIALNMVHSSEKPALLLDMGDNIGGGSPGNNICLLEGLEADGKLRYFLCIYDPEAVREVQKYNEEEKIKILIDGIRGELPVKIELDVAVIKICEGSFKEANPRHGGQVNYKMGKTAIVSLSNGSMIMLTSLRVPPFSLQQLLAFDIYPEQFDAIVAKGVNAPIAAYASVCPTVIQVNTPGATQADMTKFNFSKRRVPLYPFEKI